jgi:hypothetical protein
MNVKQFLKPDWRKILIFVIMIVIYLFEFLVANASFCGPQVIITSRQNCSHYYTKYWVSPCSLFCGEPDFLTSLINTIYYPLWLIGIIILYLLSCLIVWIYDKSRKRK